MGVAVSDAEFVSDKDAEGVAGNVAVRVAVGVADKDHVTVSGSDILWVALSEREGLGDSDTLIDTLVVGVGRVKVADFVSGSVPVSDADTELERSAVADSEIDCVGGGVKVEDTDHV
jgi:hypothetical protein